MTEAIIRKLKAAFPATRSHSQFPLVSSHLGDEPKRVSEEFRDKLDWTQLAPSWLDGAPDGLGSALSFMSNDAICFYIPAYIMADIGGQLQRCDPTFALTHGFDEDSHDRRMVKHKDYTWTDYGRARWASLTQEQALVIVHYLEWRAHKDGLTFGSQIVEALRRYWYQRAALNDAS